MPIINAITSPAPAIITTVDNTGNLVFQNAGTTNMTLDVNQNAIHTGYISAPNTFGFKNRIINGGMVIDQRNAGASFTNSNAAVYGVDRWLTYGITSGVFTCQQVTDAPTGFGNSFKLTISTATTANDGGAFPVQKIEASNCTDLMWGTSSAATVTISFWVKASVTGTYNTSLVFYGPTTLYYVSTFTVNSANTWEQKTITVTGPTTGGAFSGSLNAAYLALYTVAIGSSGYTTYATANTWSSTGSIKTSGTVNLGSTLNATLQVTGVQLEKGSTSTSFDYRPYGTELQLCQRYYQIFTATGQEWIYNESNGASNKWWQFYIPQTMRTTPSASLSGMSTGGAINGTGTTVSSVAVVGITTSRCSVRVTAAGAGGGAYQIYHTDGWSGNAIPLSAEL